jgi:hypothetical protein
MQRYVVYLCEALRKHGVVIANDQPPTLGPFNPTVEGGPRKGLGAAAAAAYKAGGCAPQLILVVLPGR